jgi:hypothetical protein
VWVVLGQLLLHNGIVFMMIMFYGGIIMKEKNKVEEKTLTTFGLARKYIEQNWLQDGLLFCQQILEADQNVFSAKELAYFFGLIAETQEDLLKAQEKELESTPEIIKPKNL